MFQFVNKFVVINFIEHFTEVHFLTFIQLFKAFRITGSSGSVDGICWKIIKQTVHFVHLTCVL